MIEDILRDREKRYERVMELSQIYKVPVLCGKINYPGVDKNTNEAKFAFKILREELQKVLDNIIFSETLEGADGYSFLAVVAMDSLELKKIAVKIEESHPFGRLFDIDVYIESGCSIERGQIGHPKRKCIICGENPRICSKTNKHSFEDVINAVNKIIVDYGEGNGN